MNWRCRARHALAYCRRALAHSLRVRLVALFVLLAFAMSAIFLGGMQYALSIGWRDAARPMVIDYVDKLAADIGSPPSVERAQALVDRLPLRITISGPVVNWRSHPEQTDHSQRWRDSSQRDQEAHLLERKTLDGLERPATLYRLGHLGFAAAVHRPGLPAGAPLAAPAGRYPRRRAALWRWRLCPADCGGPFAAAR
jgi:hypothetical protein